MTERPLILISNDDSINAPGLRVLVDCVKNIGNVWVVAPEKPQSGMSSAMTVNGPLRIKEYPEYNGAKMYSVDGTPVDCIKLALHHIVPKKPDVIVSGVNHGSNAGNNVLYSGTMGATMEGAMIGIPAIGFSLLSHSLSADFSHCTDYITSITETILREGLPYRTCLNINFPKNKINGLKVVRTALSHWTEEYREYVDPHGKPFYWLTGSMINEEPDSDDTDLYWLDRNFATIVPTQIDQSDLGLIPSVKELLEE